MTPRNSPFALAAVVAAALGVCALAASVMAPINGVRPWLLAAGGAALLIIAVIVLWIIHRRRDRSLW